MPLVHVNDIDIFYEEQGEGEPLVLIAGIGQWRAFWYRNVEALAEHFRVITFDNRGIGESTKPEGEITVEDMGRDVIALLEELGIEKAHLLGHSMGGGVAIEATRQAPEKVDKLVLASTLYWGPKVVMPSQRAMELMTNRGGDPTELIKRGIEVSTAPGFAEANPDVVEKLVELRLKSNQPPEQYLRQSAAGGSYSMTGDHIVNPAPIDKPTLLIVGDKDEVAPPANSEAIAEAWPNAKLLIIEGAGHLVNIEKPDEFNRAVIGFLKG